MELLPLGVRGLWRTFRTSRVRQIYTNGDARAADSHADSSVNSVSHCHSNACPRGNGYSDADGLTHGTYYGNPERGGTADVDPGNDADGGKQPNADRHYQASLAFAAGEACGRSLLRFARAAANHWGNTDRGPQHIGTASRSLP